MWVSTPTSDLHAEAATDPDGRRRGLLSGWGSSADTPSGPSPAHTAEHRGSLACLRAFAPAIPCLAHSPNSCSLSGVQQPPASAAHHIPRSSCSLARRLQPWGGGGAPRLPCPALPPCLLVYVPPHFPVGPSGSLSRVLALSSTEPADVSQMNRSHSAKLCAHGQAGDRPSPALKNSGLSWRIPPQTHHTPTQTHQPGLPDGAGVLGGGQSPKVAEDREEEVA